MESRKVVINGISIAVNTFGDKKNPPLFLIHGIKQVKEIFTGFAEMMSKDFFVVAYDNIGHGQSGKPKTLTLVDQANALFGLIEHFGYKDAYVIGESMGSYIAQQAALLNQNVFRKLVLLVTKGEGKTSSVAEYLKRIGVDAKKVSPQELLKVCEGAIWAPTTPQSLKDETNKILDESEPLTPEQSALIDKSCAGFDFRPELHKLHIPVMVVAGEHDGLNPPSRGKEVADLIPGAKFVIVKDGGHYLRIEHPQEFAKLTKDFFLGK
jgi:3-oxoadipate enol-lactonase